MELKKDWNQIRKNFGRYGASSFHFSMATSKPDGSPWVTPIGSLMLNKDRSGIYFEIFTRGMPRNLRTDSRIVVMGVHSGRWFWLKSVLLGRFDQPPAIRLVGRAGELRRATEREKNRFKKIFGPLRFTAGFKKMWRQIAYVRDITFEEAVAVNIGTMY